MTFTENDAYTALVNAGVEDFIDHTEQARRDDEWQAENGPEDPRYIGLTADEVAEAISDEWREQAEWERDQSELWWATHPARR